MDKNLDLTVIIVTHNSESTIAECLESIYRACKRVKIIVFDNASEDESVSIVKKYSQAEVITSDINLGFGKANNIAVKRTKTQYILLLNPDTKLLDETMLTTFVNVSSMHPDYGLFGPKVVYSDGSVQLTVRNDSTVINAIKEYIFKIRGAYDFYQPDGEDLCEVQNIKGAVMFLKKDLFESIGGFDERFFMYFEDLDLCRRIRSAGLKVGYLPTVVVSHIEGVSGRGHQTQEYAKLAAKQYHGLIGDFLINWIGRIGHKL